MSPIAIDHPHHPFMNNKGDDLESKTDAQKRFEECSTSPSKQTVTLNGISVKDMDAATNHNSLSDWDIPLRDTPAFTARKLRVITVGAGFSAMIFAHKLRYRHPEIAEIVDHTIYEARDETGGTWLVNNYPGVQCDVPAHIYAFPFDPNPDWNRFYATGPEIHEYFVRTVKKWDLDRDIVFNTKVVGAHWQENEGKWKVTLERQGQRYEETADVFISAQGFLNSWKWPEIEGLQDFRGQKVHSAAWDHSQDYAHKRIAVIGNGSSGIQILPEIAKLPGVQAVSFQRGPTWVVSRHDPGRLVGKANAGSNPEYTEEEKEKFRTDPQAHHAYRKNLIHRTNQAFRMVSIFVPCVFASADTRSLSKTPKRIVRVLKWPRSRWRPS